MSSTAGPDRQIGNTQNVTINSQTLKKWEAACESLRDSLKDQIQPQEPRESLRNLRQSIVAIRDELSELAMGDITPLTADPISEDEFSGTKAQSIESEDKRNKVRLDSAMLEWYLTGVSGKIDNLWGSEEALPEGSLDELLETTRNVDGHIRDWVSSQ